MHYFAMSTIDAFDCIFFPFLMKRRKERFGNVMHFCNERKNSMKCQETGRDYTLWACIPDAEKFTSVEICNNSMDLHFDVFRFMDGQKVRRRHSTLMKRSYPVRFICI